MVLGDPAYGTRGNRRYLKKYRIRFAGKPLGCPRRVTDENREEPKRLKAWRREDYLQRVPIEGKFGQGLLQRAVAMMLEPIYEQDFLDCSYGFRPKRSAPGALAALWRQGMDQKMQYIIDLDIRKFFDSLDRAHLGEFLQSRVRDGVITRLIGKWLNAGVMEQGTLHLPEHGTPQGGSMTPRTQKITSNFPI